MVVGQTQRDYEDRLSLRWRIYGNAFLEFIALSLKLGPLPHLPLWI